MSDLYSTGIRPYIDKYMLDKAAEKRDYGIYWSASSAGYCMRKVIFDRLGVPPVEEDARKERIFESGHVFHEWIQRVTRNAGISIAQELELQDEKYFIRGHIDDLVVVGEAVMLIDYKGLAIDTPILTIDGWKTMGKIAEGDVVFDGSGAPTKVVHKSEVHHRDCYRLSFRDGESVICDDEHRWLVDVPGRGETIVTAEELAAYGGLKRIRLAGALQGTATELPIDPYVLGAWLADGDSSDGRICTPDSRIWDEIKRRGYEVGENIAADASAESRTVLGIRGKLVDLGLLRNKHIPHQYLMASYGQRLDMLRGFMDGDGYWNKTRKRYVTNTTNPTQRDYITTLIASLGLKPSVHEYQAHGFGLDKTAWAIDFVSSENPFLARNEEANAATTGRSKYRYLKSIEPVQSVPTQCIEVDSIEHTYLAGTSLLKTHNTQSSRAFQWQKKLGKGLSHYHKMQLGTYMYLLRKVDALAIEGAHEWPEHTPGNIIDLLHDLKEARIIRISKDDLCMSEDELLWTPALAKQVAEYWGSLNSYWDRKQIPRCTCAEFEVNDKTGVGFMADKRYNPYYYAGEPCSLKWLEKHKELLLKWKEA